MFRFSTLPATLEADLYAGAAALEDTYHILGDQAYPLSKEVMTPYQDITLRGGLTPQERLFNRHLSSKRQVRINQPRYVLFSISGPLSHILICSSYGGFLNDFVTFIQVHIVWLALRLIISGGVIILSVRSMQLCPLVGTVSEIANLCTGVTYIALYHVSCYCTNVGKT